MKAKEHLKKLNEGCTLCRVKMCSACPVGAQKKKLKAAIGGDSNSLLSKLKNLFRK